MTGRISITDLKRAITLYEVVAEKVALKRAGRELVGLCPFHREKSPSFYVHAGKNLYRCYGCGAAGDVIRFYRDIHGVDDKTAIRELAARAGLLPSEEASKVEPRQVFAAPIKASFSEARDAARKAFIQEWAIGIWRESKPAAGTLVESYLAKRGIDVAMIGGMPPSLRFHPNLPSDSEPGSPSFPAMVAGVQDVDGKVRGIHRTFLDRTGEAKAPIGKQAKKMLGQCWGGCARFAAAGERLVIGEGIETCLSVMQALRLNGDMTPVWAALSLGNIAGTGDTHRCRCKAEREHPTRPGVMIPPPWPDLSRPGFVPPAQARELIILGDGDSDPFITRALVDCARRRFQHMGLTVRVAWAAPGKDFNDMLKGAAEG